MPAVAHACRTHMCHRSSSASVAFCSSLFIMRSEPRVAAARWQRSAAGRQRLGASSSGFPLVPLDLAEAVDSLLSVRNVLAPSPSRSLSAWDSLVGPAPAPSGCISRADAASAARPVEPLREDMPVVRNVKRARRDLAVGAASSMATRSEALQVLSDNDFARSSVS